MKGVGYLLMEDGVVICIPAVVSQDAYASNNQVHKKGALSSSKHMCLFTLSEVGKVASAGESKSISMICNSLSKMSFSLV